MPYNTDTAGRSRLRPDFEAGELDRTDRILLAACAGIWLAALAAGVAATVALVDLGRGHPESSGDSGTPWLLYTVIGVSAVVIVGAVPLLLRARRTAMEESQPPARPAVRTAPGEPPPPVRGAEASTEKLRVLGTAAVQINPRPGYPAPRAATASAPPPSVAAVDQLWLRCAVVIACAIGVAVVAIGVATYLMAVDSNAAAWVFYGLAGLITLGMPAVPWFYLRALRAVVEKPAA
jgi:Protein of unknown function (DUF2561)